MVSFPLIQIPIVNTVSVLGKMGYREASRMRRTCHRVDELVQLNLAKLRFPVERITFGVNISDFGCGQMVLRPTIDFNEENDHGTFIFLLDHQRVDCAWFDRITLCMLRLVENASELPIVEFIETNKIKARQLHFLFGLIDGIDLFSIYKACGASSVDVGANADDAMTATAENLPFSFDTIRQLADLGCDDLRFPVCSLFPDDFVEILSKFKIVEIDNIIQNCSPSFAPLIQRMITDPSVPLRKFWLPIYNRETFLSQEEMEDLEMEQWRFDILHAEGSNSFIIATDTDYVMITERRENGQHSCNCVRIAKENIEKFVFEWFDQYMIGPIPYDASVLYEYIVEHQENHAMVEEYMTAILHNTYTYPFSEE